MEIAVGEVEVETGVEIELPGQRERRLGAEQRGIGVEVVAEMAAQPRRRWTRGGPALRVDLSRDGGQNRHNDDAPLPVELHSGLHENGGTLIGDAPGESM